MQKEVSIMLPVNPKLEDFLREARDISQLAKMVQNIEHPWPSEHWRKISKAIEKIEESTSQLEFKK